MKTTNIGLILLTVLVAAKYFISLDTYTSQDGSFKSGIAIDYTVVSDLILQEDQPSNPELLAYNVTVSETALISPPSKKKVNQTEGSITETSEQTTLPLGFQDESEETLPMEHVNSLVVFDPSSPVLLDMKTQYVDQYDNATPLDNGNTVVNEMQMMMPRR